MQFNSMMTANCQSRQDLATTQAMVLPAPFAHTSCTEGWLKEHCQAEAELVFTELVGHSGGSQPC